MTPKKKKKEAEPTATCPTSSAFLPRKTEELNQCQHMQDKGTLQHTRIENARQNR